jgi:hypothetical protein
MPCPQSERNTFRPVVAAPDPNRRMRRFIARELRQLQTAICVSAAACDADRYRKHFDAVAHFGLLVFHGLQPHASLRGSYAAIQQCPAVLAASGLVQPDGTPTVSFSQFAASNTTRPAAFVLGILPGLIQRVQHSTLPRADRPLELRIIDSTFLRLSHHLADWLPTPGPRGTSGVWVQLEYTPADGVVHSVVTSDRRSNDVQRLDAALFESAADLVERAGTTLVTDLGFYSHARFAALRAGDVHLLTRLHPQAATADQVDRPVQRTLPGLPAACRGRITVTADVHATVGSPNNRAGAVLPHMRLVTATVEPTTKAARAGMTGVTYELLTDRWDVSAEAVVQWYLWRWEIENFFRWLKRGLGLIRLVGHSANAVELSLWVALLVHLLCLLAAAGGVTGHLASVLAQLPWLLSQCTLADLMPADRDHDHLDAISVTQLPLMLGRDPGG